MAPNARSIEWKGSSFVALSSQTTKLDFVRYQGKPLNPIIECSGRTFFVYVTILRPETNDEGRADLKLAWRVN